MKRGGNPIRGSLMLTGGRLVSSFCGLVLFWLIARRGASDLGVFRTLLSFFLITELFPLLGLQIYLTREIAVDRTHLRKYILHSVLLALAVSLVGILVICAIARWGSYSPAVSKGLLIITGAMPATAVYLCALPVLIALERGATVGVLQAVETFARTVIGSILVLLGWPIMSVIGAIVLVRWLVLIAYWRECKPPPEPEGWRFEKAFLLKIVRQIPVFAGITLFAGISRFAAQVMLPWILGDKAAGQFGAAYVFIDIALLIPTALVANLMPRFSLLARDSIGHISRAAQESIKLMALGMLPVAGIVTLVAHPLLGIVFHNPEIRDAATPVLQVCIWVCFFMSVDSVLSSTIVACGKPSFDLQSVAVGAVATLGMLYVAIARLGVVGGAVGLLAGCAIQLGARFVIFGAHVPGLNPMPLIWRPVVATAAMMGLVCWIPLANWPLIVAAGILSYSLFLYVLGALSASECDGIGSLLRSRKT
jgi:O-antigen/teichoic acid export membrane protein